MAKIPLCVAYDRRYQHDRGFAPHWQERRNVWVPRGILLIGEMKELGIDPVRARTIAHQTDFVLSQMIDGVPPNTI